MPDRSDAAPTLQSVPGALPFRMRGDCMEILLITSSAGRWLIPKGGLEGDEAPFQAAEREAWEEAGVRGRIEELPYGSFDYSSPDKAQRIVVYPLVVSELLPVWPEQSRRSRVWVAAHALPADIDPELRLLITSFAEMQRS